MVVVGTQSNRPPLASRFCKNRDGLLPVTLCWRTEAGELPTVLTLIKEPTVRARDEIQKLQTDSHIRVVPLKSPASLLGVSWRDINPNASVRDEVARLSAQGRPEGAI